MEPFSDLIIIWWWRNNNKLRLITVDIKSFQTVFIYKIVEVVIKIDFCLKLNHHKQI